MNKIDDTFIQLKKEGKPAFIPFLTVGDPDLSTTLDILYELIKAGATMVELGVPYSDPLADGPIIQRASERALKNKVTILDVIDFAKKARESGIQVPFILFTHYNPLLQIGLDKAFINMKESGIDGLIVPDLPIEESGRVRTLSLEQQIHFIPLVAPTSGERTDRIIQQATGFIYCISSLGVTGERKDFYRGIEEFIEDVKRKSSLPVLVGFGISRREQVRKFSSLCDGVVVGSALVRTIEENLTLLENRDRKSTGLKNIGEFISHMVKG